MEFIILGIAVVVVGYFLLRQKPITPTTDSAPYKVEAETPAPVAVPDPAPVVTPLGDTTSGGGPEVDLTPAPAVVEAPAKKPRKPRAPKVVATTPVKEKAPAKTKTATKKAPAIKAKAPAAKKPRAKKV